MLCPKLELAVHDTLMNAQAWAALLVLRLAAVNDGWCEIAVEAASDWRQSCRLANPRACGLFTGVSQDFVGQAPMVDAVLAGNSLSVILSVWKFTS